MSSVEVRIGIRFLSSMPGVVPVLCLTNSGSAYSLLRPRVPREGFNVPLSSLMACFRSQPHTSQTSSSKRVLQGFPADLYQRFCSVIYSVFAS